MRIYVVVHHVYEFSLYAAHRAHTVVHTVYFGLVSIEAHGNYRYAAAILFAAALVEAGHSYLVKVRTSSTASLDEGIRGGNVVRMAEYRKEASNE